MYYTEFAKREASARRKLTIAQFVGFVIAASSLFFIAYIVGHQLANH